MSQDFKREKRYVVLKVKDVRAVLTAAEIQILNLLASKVAAYRNYSGKPALQGVFVEHDWPEFEPVWESIAYRTTVKEN
ncbi:MAG: hypothetical protein ACKO0Z_01060 [Betaproteobacteria bacterium]